MENEILPLIDFSKVKKKRRHEEPENEDQDDQELDSFINTKKKGKKKKRNKEKNETNNQEIENEDPNNNDNGAYSYDFLLKRLYNTMKARKDLSTNTEMKIPAFILGKGANDRTSWVNFGEVAEAIGRSKEHLLSYIVSDLAIEATLGQEGQMFFKTKQKISQNTLKNVVLKYTNDFVRCPNCRSFKTILRKDQSTRLPQIYCEVCKGEKTIQPIKSRGGGGKKKK